MGDTVVGAREGETLVGLEVEGFVPFIDVGAGDDEGITLGTAAGEKTVGLPVTGDDELGVIVVGPRVGAALEGAEVTGKSVVG